MEEFKIWVPTDRRQFFIDLVEQLGFELTPPPSEELLQSQIDEVRRRKSMYSRDEFSPWEDVIQRLENRRK